MALTPSPAPFTPLAFSQYVSNFIRNLVRATGLNIDTTEGSVFLALAEAASINDSFVQSQILQVGLASRLLTAQGADVDSFVNQFVPPFTSRLAAVVASSTPVDPTLLAANAVNTAASGYTYMWVQSVTQLVVNQNIQLDFSTNSASGIIAAVQPTTTLTVAAASGVVTLTVKDATAAFVNAPILLSDGIFSVTSTISAVSGNVITIPALSPKPNHTYPIGATVTFTNVLQITPQSNWSSIYANFLLGTRVWAQTLINGEKFYRNTTDQSTPYVSVGFKIQTQDNIVYTVIEDDSNPWFNKSLMQYIFRPADLYIMVPIQATVPGISSNVLANTLTVLSAPLTGINGALNPYAIANGLDAETDQALINRFQTFIAGLSKGTKAAILAAVQGVQTGVNVSVLENVASDGVTQEAGNFVVIASDANGNLGSTLYASIYSAVDAARPITTTFNLVPPNINAPTITMQLKIAAAGNIANITALVQTNIYNLFTNVPAGSTLYFNSLIQTAMAVTGVVDVLQCLVNSSGWTKPASGSTPDDFILVGAGPVDIVAGALQLLRPAMANITITGTY